MIGKRLLHYEILGSLGSGGMGEVYKARDTKLGRDVALKVLPPDMAASADRRARFQREAMAVAALQHPHIVTIFAVEEAEGTPFLTMELIEGASLDRLIPPHGMNLSQLLDLAIPVADAVAYAHGKGITHRDLKPQNIMLDAAGRPKVLDFGLAKLLESPAGPEGATVAADGNVTREGVVIGTASYMSPEQAEGKPTDARSDVFSLGIILYEMASGRKPFQGDTTISTISSILKDTPTPVTELNRSLPNHLGRVVHRCLAKDPERRYQVALDLRNELEGLKEESASGVSQVSRIAPVGLPEPSAAPPASPPPATSASGIQPPPSAPRRLSMPLLGAGGLIVALVVVLGLWQPWSNRTGKTPVKADVRITSTPAPDGKLMAVVLPFENLGPPEHAYFAAGMTDEITNRLSAVSNLGVISRTSAVQYDRSGKTLRQIGEDLGVDYVLEGTVRWAPTPDGGGQVRINPRLIRVTEDLPVWSETYDRQMTDIFQVQTEIASQVIEALGVTLLGGESDRVSEAPTENLAAYEAYTKALDLVNQDFADWDRRRTELLDTAVRLDPKFVHAWAQLVLHHISQYRLIDRTEARLGLARQALEGAAAASPDHPKTHWARGYYLYYGFREYDRALEEFQTAAAALPNDAEARRAIAYILRRKGDFRGCIEELKEAARLDPKAAEAFQNLATTYEAIRDWDQAIAYFLKGRELAPDDDDLALETMECYLNGFGDEEAASRLLAEGPGKDPIFHKFARLLFAVWQRDFARAEQVALELPDDPPFLRVNRNVFRVLCLVELKDPRAPEALSQSLAECREFLESSPGNLLIRSHLASLNSMAGNHTAALREARLAIDLGAKDKAEAPGQEELLAEVYARAGRQDEALEIVDRLLDTEYLDPLTVHELEQNIRWDPLRTHPGFQEVLEKHRQRIP